MWNRFYAHSFDIYTSFSPLSSHLCARARSRNESKSNGMRNLPRDKHAHTHLPPRWWLLLVLPFFCFLSWSSCLRIWNANNSNEYKYWNSPNTKCIHCVHAWPRRRMSATKQNFGRDSGLRKPTEIHGIKQQRMGIFVWYGMLPASQTHRPIAISTILPARLGSQRPKRKSATICCSFAVQNERNAKITHLLEPPPPPPVAAD